MRLTDQALTAVHLGRAFAEGRATVGHLLLGLLAEPEGIAGREVRRRHGGDPALRLGAGVAAPGLPALGAAMLPLPVEGPPADTVSVLRAVVRTGGADVADLLARHDLDLVVQEVCDATPVLHDPDDPGETFGRGSLRAEGFSDLADQCLARARAAGVDSTALLPWLDLPEEQLGPLRNLPPAPLEDVIARARSAADERPVGVDDLATAVVASALSRLRLDG